MQINTQKTPYKLKIVFLFVILSFSVITIAQSIKISGRLYDKENDKTISNGVLYLNPGNQVTTSDKDGGYLFTCTAGVKHITTQILGYKAANIQFRAYSDTVINIFLKVSPFELSEVTITGDSIKNVKVTQRGSIVLTPAALRETPRLFSEPDLLKSFQLMPGVVAGKDGTSDIYVRGGTMGQNVILANGCYFFLPGHLLGIVSPFDLDFLESAELYKDYFPADMGGGASSIISLDFKKPKSDSLRAQLRLGLLSSGLSLELPLKKINWDLTAGIKRGNYSIYAPLLKRIVSSDVTSFLPPDNYSFYDGFLRLSHSSIKSGNISYLFFGNYDLGKNEYREKSQSADTITNYSDGIKTGWKSMVHALQWNPPDLKGLKFKFNISYNKLSMVREMYTTSEKLFEGSTIDKNLTSNSFSPSINSIGSSMEVSGRNARFTYQAGISIRLRYFSPKISSSYIFNNSEVTNNVGETQHILEPALFAATSVFFRDNLKFDAGLRITTALANDAKFFVPEPRLRLSLDPDADISPHINYVRLSQFDHSIEGSNAGFRTMLWLPASKDLSPEISDVFSAGVQGQIKNDFVWTIDGYFKMTKGMIDYKPGASFIFDSSFVDMVDVVRGHSYGLETGIIKRKGKLTGSLSYTYSRSKREWGSPEGVIWISSSADRPHNFNIALKYYYRERTSFGLNWVYQSGAPVTIYMHETSYGEFYETKNNIRYFDYHRLDVSIRHIIYKRKFTIFLDADIYNAYNHKNTSYFKLAYDWNKGAYYYRNISLFPIMPSLTLTIRY